MSKITFWFSFQWFIFLVELFLFFLELTYFLIFFIQVILKISKFLFIHFEFSLKFYWWLIVYKSNSISDSKIMTHRQWLIWTYLSLILMWLNITVGRNIWRGFNNIIFLCDDLFLLFDFVECILIHVIYLIVVTFWLDSLSTQWQMCQSIIFKLMNGRFGIGKFFLSLFQFPFEGILFLRFELEYGEVRVASG